jgi:adenosylcobinamide-GDP ribazoletransferase
MRAALSFLTPLGGPARVSSSALSWFPVVGAGLGLVLGMAWWAAAGLWPPLVAAAVVVALDLALTGMLHLDGLADTADGLLAPHLDRDRRLAVMADVDTGAFAVGAVGAVLLLRLSALTVLAPAPLLVAGLWCASRTAMAVGARALGYARSSGLASPFLGGRPALPAVVGGTLSLALLGGRGIAGMAAILAATVAAAGVLGAARRRLGGFTGDVLGAAGMVAETAGLVVAAARW